MTKHELGSPRDPARGELGFAKIPHPPTAWLISAPGKAAAQLMALFVCAVLVAVLASSEARGQDASLNIPDAFKNSVGIGGGGGFSYSSDSPNISISADYGRGIAGPWGISLVIGYDKEFRKKDGKREQSQQFAFMAGVTYDLTERIGVVAGFSRGIIEKEHGKGWKTAGSNDWGVGGGISYSYPINDRVYVGPGFTAAYDFDSKEVRSEIEINISVAF